MAGRGAVIVAAIVGISAIFIAAFAVNAYAASNLQFRSAGSQNFDFSRLSSGVLVDACNPSPFPASFDEYRIDVYYQDDELATLSLSGKTIMPNTSERLEGSVDINGRTTASLLAQAMADAFSGEGPEDSQVTAKSTLSSRVLGIMPVSDTKELDLSAEGQTPFSEEYSCD
ncbi:MAG TPA: LEA type 2 family protein [Nitrososphaera sp.]